MEYLAICKFVFKNFDSNSNTTILILASTCRLSKVVMMAYDKTKTGPSEYVFFFVVHTAILQPTPFFNKQIDKNINQFSIVTQNRIEAFTFLLLKINCTYLLPRISCI